MQIQHTGKTCHSVLLFYYKFKQLKFTTGAPDNVYSTSEKEWSNKICTYLPMWIKNALFYALQQSALVGHPCFTVLTQYQDRRQQVVFHQNPSLPSTSGTRSRPAKALLFPCISIYTDVTDLFIESRITTTMTLFITKTRSGENVVTSSYLQHHQLHRSEMTLESCDSFSIILLPPLDQIVCVDIFSVLICR